MPEFRDTLGTKYELRKPYILATDHGRKLEAKETSELLSKLIIFQIVIWAIFQKIYAGQFPSILNQLRNILIFQIVYQHGPVSNSLCWPISKYIKIMSFQMSKTGVSKYFNQLLNTL